MKDIIFVLTYNRFEYTKRSIESLLDTTTDGSRIIVWDNGSEDEVSDWLYSKRKWFYQLILNHVNFGDHVAMNGLMALAPLKCEVLDIERPDYVIKTENDVEYEPGWKEKCIRALEGAQAEGIDVLFSTGWHGSEHPIANRIHLRGVGQVFLKNTASGTHYVLTWENFSRLKTLSTRTVFQHDWLVHERLKQFLQTGCVVVVPGMVTHFGWDEGIHRMKKTELEPLRGIPWRQSQRSKNGS